MEGRKIEGGREGARTEGGTEGRDGRKERRTEGPRGGQMRFAQIEVMRFAQIEVMQGYNSKGH